jgi:oligopeptidase B
MLLCQKRPRRSRRLSRASNRRRITQIGRTRVDNYAWLKDDNWQEVMRDPSLLKADIRAYLDEENAYRDQQMASTAALQERIYQEMRGRTKEDDSSVPSPDGRGNIIAASKPARSIRNMHANRAAAAPSKC